MPAINRPDVSWDDLEDNDSTVSDIVVMRTMEIAASLKRLADEYLYVARTSGITPYELKEASEELIDKVYELELVLAGEDREEEVP